MRKSLEVLASPLRLHVENYTLVLRDTMYDIGGVYGDQVYLIKFLGGLKALAFLLF